MITLQLGKLVKLGCYERGCIRPNLANYPNSWLRVVRMYMPQDQHKTIKRWYDYGT